MRNLVSFGGFVRAWQRLPPESSLKRGPFRGLHAAWSVLLSYEWLSYSGLADRVIIGDEPESVTGLLKKKQSDYHNILLIHGDKSNKQEIRNLAEHIIEKNRLLQCITVDLRGHGYSSGDDYDKPHTIQSATEDIIDVILATFHDINHPVTVIGVDKLGSAIALEYCKFTSSQKMGVKMSSEVTGVGAIKAPKRCVLCLKYNKDSIINNTASKLLVDDPSPDCDEGMAEELNDLASNYMQGSDLTSTNERYKLYIVDDCVDTVDSIGKQLLAAINAV